MHPLPHPLLQAINPLNCIKSHPMLKILLVEDALCQGDEGDPLCIGRAPLSSTQHLVEV